MGPHRHVCAVFALCGCGLAVAAPPGAVAAGPGGGPAPLWVRFADPTTDALIEQLRHALVDRADGGPDRLMVALRQLRDPALRPLFAQLAAGERPMLRVHGILGLAELESPPRIDLLLVKRIPEAREQLVVLGEALRQGLMEPSQLRDVVRWPGLDETLLALVLGKLSRNGAPDTADELRRLAASSNHAASVFAAMELVQAGIEVPPIAAPEETTDQAVPVRATALARVAALDPSSPEDAEAISRILGYIRDHRLTRLAPLTRTLWKHCSGETAGRVDAARTLLLVAASDPETLTIWNDTYGAADLAGRIRLGLGALDAALADPAACPAGAFAPMTATTEPSPLLHAIGAAGAAALGGAPPGELATAAAVLAAQQHRPSSEWLVTLAAARSADEARAIRAAVLDASCRAEVLRAQPELADPVVRAAAALAERSPDAWRDTIRQRLEAGDEPAVESLLAGALQSASALAAESLDGLFPPDRAALMPTARAMADLARSRAVAEVGPADFDRLAAIAMGAGSLPEASRVQAAWLALRCRGEQRVALARVLAENSP